MKRIKIIIAFVVLAIGLCSAQRGLAIAELFNGKFRGNQSVTETAIKGDAITPYSLDIYRSISVANSPAITAEIEKAVSKDAKNAIDSEVQYKGGKLYYAFYRMPTKELANRYILYINESLNGGAKTILMYLEGDASPKKIKSMFKHK